jgi:hypothetical protein
MISPDYICYTVMRNKERPPFHATYSHTLLLLEPCYTKTVVDKG